MASLLHYVGIVAALLTLGLLLWRLTAAMAIASLAIAIAMDCFDLGKQGLDLGVFVYPEDVACVILLCAGLLTIVRARKLPPRSAWPLLALFVLMVVNMARGAVQFGVKPSGNGTRDLAYLIIPPLAIMFLRADLQLNWVRLAKWLGLLGLALAVLAASRWADLLPTPASASDDDFREIARVLNSEYAMVLGQALLAALSLQVARGFSWWGLILAGAFSIEILFLQHRTVWMALVVGLMWLALRTTRLSRTFWLGASIAAISTILMCFAIVPQFKDGTWTLIAANVEEALGDNSTWTWRTQGFNEVFDRAFSGGVGELWIGPPAGRDLGSEASFASVHIHDRYVATFAYYGILGEILFVAWLLIVARGIGGWIRVHRRIDRDHQVGRVLLQSIFLTLITFFIPYNGSLALGGVFGLAWAVSTIKPIRVKTRHGDCELIPRVREPQLSSVR